MPGKPERKMFDQQDVIEALKKVGADKDCPRCGGSEFKIMPGFFSHPIQSSSQGMQIGGPSVTTWVIICTNCGFLSEHAAEILMGLTQIEAVKH